MYIANVTEDGFENNPYLDAVRDYATGEDYYGRRMQPNRS